MELPVKYRITCTMCNSDLGIITIFPGDRVDYRESIGVDSARKRTDGHWGFQCAFCNHYSLAASSEVDFIIKQSRVNEFTRNHLQKVVAKRKTLSMKTAKGKYVDGFIMEKVNG